MIIGIILGIGLLAILALSIWNWFLRDSVHSLREVDRELVARCKDLRTEEDKNSKLEKTIAEMKDKAKKFADEL